MKKIVFIVLFLWTHICSVSSQIQEKFWNWQVIDTVKILCVYDHSSFFTFRSSHLKGHEAFRLEIGPKHSKYYSIKAFESDSLYYTTPQAKQEYQRRVLESLKVKGDANETSLEKMRKIVPGGSRNEVYKNYPTQDSIFVHDAWSGRSKYTEEMIPQEWKIQPDTMVILGYACQKATCKWRGRDYISWFTEEIPVSDGPYKFFGLPGLIVSVEDSTGEYGWQLQSVEMPHGMRIYMAESLNGQEYKQTDRLSELRKQWKSRLQMVKKVNSDAIMLGKEPGETEDPYDLIELDYK